MNTKRGKFIVLDGSEGAGKSSQLKSLKEKFGDRVLVTREPGGTPYAEEIRNVILNSSNASQADAKTHFALFWASRADHMRNKIIPALESGMTVITDRFDSSTFAYQIFGQEATELKDHFFAFRDFFLGDYKPDLYVYLDVDTKVGLARKSNQPDEINHFEARKVEFFERMKQGFAEFFKHVPYLMVDANGDFVSVQKDLISIIEKQLNS